MIIGRPVKVKSTEPDNSEKGPETSPHQQRVELITRIAKNLGAERVQIPKAHFESFTPDLLVTLGPKEKMTLDYVHTSDSFPRDFTGMQLLMGEHRAKRLDYYTYRLYYLVLSDEVYQEMKKELLWLMHLPWE